MDTATEAKLEAMHEDIRDLVTAVRSQNGRIRKLEIWRGYVAGAISVILLFELWKAFI